MGDIGIGTRYHQTRKTDSQDLKIIELEPNRKISIETIPPSKPSLSRKMVFKSENGRTVIEDHWELESGAAGILERLAAGKVKRAVADNLTKLKELLETGSTTLQDGRRIQQ
jgi:hypothetical protein